MNNYPPGVTGNEPQITGEWPCDLCYGLGYELTEDGKEACELCGGSGIIPDDAMEMSLIHEELKSILEGYEPDFDVDKDGYLYIYTNLKQIGKTNYYRSES
jgi:hypothetical protein